MQLAPLRSSYLLLLAGIFLAAFIFASQSAQASEPAGQLMFVHGQVWVERDGNRLEAKRGTKIFPGDILITEAASSAQLRFSDGGTNALRPNSHFTLKDYHHDTAKPQAGRKSGELLRGGLRTISGAIGRATPDNVEYKTPVATMGIRGTTFLIIHNERGTFLRVEDGVVLMVSEGGARIARKGQAFQVNQNRLAPKRIPPADPVFDERLEADQGSSPSEEETREVVFLQAEQQYQAQHKGIDLELLPVVEFSGEEETSDLNNLQDDTRRDESLCQSEGYESCTAKENDLSSEAACQAEGYSSCAAKEDYLAAEQACQAEGYSSCAAKEDYLAAEAACQDEGYSSCAAKEDYLAAEAACQSEGYSSCAAKEAYLAAEAACQDEGYSSCATKEAYLAAEAACQDEGYSSCAAKEDYFAAEATCQSEGYSSCAAKEAYLAAEAACQDEGYSSCAAKEEHLAAEAACQSEGYSSCAAKEEYLAAEAACQSEGYSSCAAKEDYLAAEAACQAEGYSSCAAKEDYLAAEQACQAEGYSSCAAKEDYLAAEAACQDEGYSSCAAKEDYLAAEAACQSEGYSSCAAKEDHLAAEAACQAEGYSSCAAKEDYLAAEQACQDEGYESCADRDAAQEPEPTYSSTAEAACSDLGFASCDELENQTYAAAPLASTGGTLIRWGPNPDDQRVLAPAATDWSGNEHPAVFYNPTSLRFQSGKNATPEAVGRLVATEDHPGSTDFYWGIWSTDDLILLDPDTLEPMSLNVGDLHYIVASQFASDSATGLSNLAASGQFFSEPQLGLSVEFHLAGGTGLTALATTGASLRVLNENSYLVYEELSVEDGSSLFMDLALDYSDTGTRYWAYDTISLSSLLGGDSFALSIVDENENEVGSADVDLRFTGNDTEVDGAISQLTLDMSTADGALQAYGNLVWLPYLLSCIECQPEPGMSVSVSGLVSGDYLINSKTLNDDLISSLTLSNEWQVNPDEAMSSNSSTLMDASGYPAAEVNWGYWEAGTYSYEGTDVPTTATSENFHYLLTDTAFSGDLQVNEEIVFNLQQSHWLQRYNGSTTEQIELVAGGIALQPDSGTAIDVTLTFADESVLTGTHNLAAATLADLPQITLTNSEAGAVTAGSIKGFFVGENAEGLAAWLEAIKDSNTFTGTPVFQRQFP